MSNLKFSCNPISFQAVSVAENNSQEDEILTARNLGMGPRGTRYFANITTDIEFQFDLSDQYASQRSTVDHIIVGDMFTVLVPTIFGHDDLTISRSSSPSSGYSNEFTDSGITTGDLVGSNGRDYLATFSESSQYQHWRVGFSGGSPNGAGYLSLSKLYLGKAFDWERNPDFSYERKQIEQTSWYSTSGARYFAENTDRIYSFEFNFEGVTRAKIDEFNRNVARYSKILPVGLFTTDEHQILDNKRVIFCFLTGYESRQEGRRKDWHDVRLRFEESPG